MSAIRRAAIPIAVSISALVALCFAIPAHGQQVSSSSPQPAPQQATQPAPQPAAQPYVGRYDLFGGFTNLDSPHIGLNENGYHIQAGINPRRWYSLGVDYSNSNGSLDLTPSLLPTDKQQQLAAELAQLLAAGLILPTYKLSVPTDSFTQTFAAGPQLEYRHFRGATLFLRPSVGAIRERATPHPQDPVAILVAASLAPAGYKIDWTPFYGFGGGADMTVTKHFAIRAQFDFVHDHLFNDLLKDGRNTLRLSIGPSFRFGKNVSR